MVHEMDAEEKLKAVEYWNVVSEQLQLIVNHSAGDIGAFTFHVDGEKVPDYIDATQLVALGLAPTFMTNFIATSTAAIASSRKCQTSKNVEEVTVPGDVMKETQTVLENELMPLQIDVATTTDLASTTVETQENAEQENEEPQIPDDVGEENTVHLMISAESKPTSLADPQVNTYHKKKAKKINSITDDENCEVDKDFYECKYCHRSFCTPFQLTAHTWTHTKPYTCSICHSRFSSKGNLVVHNRRHSGERPYMCVQCDARFSTKGNLVRHRKAHSGEKPWECSQCGSRFTEKKSLKVHMRRHTGERPYRCTVCNKSFTQTGILQTHMAMHLDQRSHVCNLCGKSFRQKSQLRLHEQRHAGLRKYQCPQCSFKFLTKGDMERHKRTHTGERPFICKLCSKSFTRQQSLNEHMNRHYGLKPYECKYCKKGYVEMSACYKHIKTHERSKTESNTNTQAPLLNSSSQDAGNIVLMVHQGSNNEAIAEKDKLGMSNPVDLTTVVIQRVSKTIQLNTEPHSRNLKIAKKGKDSVNTHTDTDVLVEQTDDNNMAFTAMNILASASTFPQK